MVTPEELEISRGHEKAIWGAANDLVLILKSWLHGCVHFVKFCQATYNDFCTFLHVCHYASKEFRKVERRKENITVFVLMSVSSHSTKKSCRTKEVSLAGHLDIS